MRQHIGVPDEFCCIREYSAAGCVIPVIMAVDDISDRHAKTFCKFLLQPCCKVGVDRIGQHDPLVRNEKDSTVILVHSTVDATGDRRDGIALGRILCACVRGD
jgi:hypothetical protein